jgi:ketosteroid isomerase-like protein
MRVTILAINMAVMLTIFTSFSFAHEKPAVPIVKSAPANANANADSAVLAVNQVVDKLRAAIATGNATLAEESIAENITIFEQGHAELSRAEYLSHHYKEDVLFAKAVPSVVVSSQTKVEGKMALVTAFTTTDGMYKDKLVKNAGVETYVLRLQNGRWQIEHAHWSSRKRQ